MKQRIEQKLGAKFTEFEAVKYKTQIVTELIISLNSKLDKIKIWACFIIIVKTY